jgi:cholesterol transport system auxiliary component
MRGARALIPALAAAVLLAACVSLLPKQKPVRLYRFGAEPAGAAAPAPPPPAGPRFAVRLAPLSFDRAAAGDRILTATGAETAYIAGARWVSPASSLFESTLARAFDARAAHARLLPTGEPGAPDLVLKLDVRTFEIRYAGGRPRAEIVLAAALVDRRQASEIASRDFRAGSEAESNSVHAMTAAFDRSLAEVLAALTAWVDARGAA